MHVGDVNDHWVVMSLLLLDPCHAASPPVQLSASTVHWMAHALGARMLCVCVVWITVSGGWCVCVFGGVCVCVVSLLYCIEWSAPRSV